MLTTAQRKQLVTGAAQLGLRLDAPTVERFDRFAALLEEGNRRLNLTRIAPTDVVTLHFLDSLALNAAFSPQPGSQVLDVGTGAGFPGLPLAIVYPEIQVTLLDGTRKRLDFLDEVIGELAISNATTQHGRAEELARMPGTPAKYDLVTARAVAKLDRLVGWMLPLVKPGGWAIAYKSQELDDEVEAARPSIGRQGGVLERVIAVPLPHTDILRKLVCIHKHRSAAPAASSRRRPSPA